MIKPELDTQTKKLLTLNEQYKRFIKRLELNLREEKRKSARLEVELYNLKRRTNQNGE